MFSRALPRRRRLLLLCHSATVLIFALLLVFAHVRGRDRYTLESILQKMKKEGIQPTTTDLLLSRDGAVQLSAVAFERVEPYPYGPRPRGYPDGKLYYEVSNSADRRLLVCDALVCMECSSDGAEWYPFTGYLLEHLMADTHVFSCMGNLMEFTLGHWDDELFAKEGTETRGVLFNMNRFFQDSAYGYGSMMIPDGFYRLIVRFCEEVEPNDIWHHKAKLTDVGYYSAEFQVKGGELVTE